MTSTLGQFNISSMISENSLTKNLRPKVYAKSFLDNQAAFTGMKASDFTSEPACTCGCFACLCANKCEFVFVIIFDDSVCKLLLTAIPTWLQPGARQGAQSEYTAARIV